MTIEGEAIEGRSRLIDAAVGLVLLLAVVGALGGAGWWAWGRYYDTGGVPVPVPGDAPEWSALEPLDPALVARAEQELARSEAVAHLTALGDYRVAAFSSMLVEERLVGVILDVEFEEALETSGPWRILHCQGTRIWESVQEYSGVEHIFMYYHLGKGEFIAYAPGPDDDGRAPRRVGEIERAPRCPFNKSDG